MNQTIKDKITNKLEDYIRRICTTHKPNGGGYYNLSEEQFQKLFDLYEQNIIKVSQEAKGETQAKLENRYPDNCHCHFGGNYKDCKRHPVISCEHCKENKSEEGTMEERFDKQFTIAIDLETKTKRVSKDIKDFIHQELAIQRKELIDKIKKMKYEGQNVYLNESVDKVIKLLEKMKSNPIKSGSI